MAELGEPLDFTCGARLKNRFMLAPLTNLQSGADGVLGEDELKWLTKRAEGGFGLTMTCATSVQRSGVGFPGQLGIHDDGHVAGLGRLAATLKSNDTHAVVQLQHSGMRARADYCDGVPQCPSDDEKTGARAMTLPAVKQLVDDFVSAAERAQRAGFDGVELHGAHGYLLCEFLSPKYNRREDQYGGSAENRARLLMEIIEGVNQRCGRAFSLGVRLSPERFGLDTAEIHSLAGQLLMDDRLDYLDMSLWDINKPSEHPDHQGESLIELFAALPRGQVRLGAAGKVYSGNDCVLAMQAGLDFVVVGRGAILHHDFPRRVLADRQFEVVDLPVTRAYLAQEGLGPAFQDYMATWEGFVAD